MDDVIAQRHRSLLYITLGALLFTAVVLAGAVWFVSHLIVKPLNSLTMEVTDKSRI